VPESSAIDVALLALLQTDASLLAVMPDGVWWEVAPPGAERFVVVSLLHESDTSGFGGRMVEDALYLVKAVALSTLPTASQDVRAGAARIDELLERGTLTADGYTTMLLERRERVRITEIDEVDENIRWFHRGGHYAVLMST
jgi:hypothetical protein